MEGCGDEGAGARWEMRGAPTGMETQGNERRNVVKTGNEDEGREEPETHEWSETMSVRGLETHE